MNKRLFLVLVVPLFFIFYSCAGVCFWDEKHLAYVKKQITNNGHSAYAKAYDRLIKKAGNYLNAGTLWSVTYKDDVPPSGDKHDYMSLAPYWWRNPDTHTGLPYIRKDGERNPEYVNSDFTGMEEMTVAVKTLALAYYFSNDKKYAEYAIKLLKTWFLDQGTKMNPNLNFGQGIPGKITGRSAGLIETTVFIPLFDGLWLLQDSELWTKSDDKKLKKWFADFWDWMQNDKIGKEESIQPHNHGTWYDAQFVAIALYLGEHEKAKQIILNQSIPRIKAQIASNGSQPYELQRTKSWSYSNYNLKGLYTLALLAEHVGIDLWQVSKENSKPELQLALDYLIPALKDSTIWTAKQITPIRPNEIVFALQIAFAKYKKNEYYNLLNDVIDKNSENILLWHIKEI